MASLRDHREGRIRFPVWALCHSEVRQGFEMAFDPLALRAGELLQRSVHANGRLADELSERGNPTDGVLGPRRMRCGRPEVF